MPAKALNDSMTGSISHFLEEIASCSQKGPGVTRLPFTPEHKAASKVIEKWMLDAGLRVSVDHAGTIIGRREGPYGAPTLLFGSHQDTVRNGGKFDGIMGVLLPILALGELDSHEFGFSIEVLAFADEEGVRFPTALLGPRALAGTLDPNTLNSRDEDGVMLAQAMKDYGLNPDALSELDRRNTPLLGYVETHIEQGPILEDMEQSLGVVSAISGIERFQVTLVGEAGHAGTVPMNLRHDTLVCAAEFLLAVETMAKNTAELIVTVGKLVVAPNAVNVIPGRVTLTVEVRSASDEIRQRAGDDILLLLDDIATRRQIIYEFDKTYEQAASPCDPGLQGLLSDVVSDLTGKSPSLPSGATHDAAAMADLCPTAMLFVRCKNGVSHSPEEFACEADMRLAVDALKDLISKISAKLGGAFS